MLKTLLFIVLAFIYTNMFSQIDSIDLISWNIRDFGKTKKSETLNKIAEIVKYSDILAIQEVVAGYGGAQAVAKLTAILNRKGHKWDYVISDPTNSPKFVTERYAFIWKTKHIKIKNRGRLITELDTLIDREPFLLDFYLDKKQFTIVNFHSRPYSRDPESEIKALSQFITGKLQQPLILVGDFNVNEKKVVFNNLKAKGFSAAVFNKKTTLKKICKKGNYLNHAIDNIFYSQDIIKLETKVLDFVRFCESLETARELSDHLPVYLKFNF